MTTAPTWTDSDQGDLLELVAQGSSTGTADREWAAYIEALRTVAVANAGTIRPNVLRPRLRGLIAPQRCGAFTSRAIARGLVAYTGDWETSDDREGRNGGKPARILRALPALFSP